MMNELEREAIDRIAVHTQQVHDLLMVCIKEKRVPPIGLPTQLKVVLALALKLKEN